MRVIIICLLFTLILAESTGNVTVARHRINEGDSINKGDTLCIIEAMKIMNEIEAEENGIIHKILVENGHAVEFNQPLFLINPK